MLVIGIAGKKRSGKDITAQMFIDAAERLGIKATRRALADELKEECATMVAAHSDKVATDVLIEMNTDGQKEQYRLLLQWWGTEFKRNMVSDTYWTDKLHEWVLHHHRANREMVIVPDVRFLNEVKMIKQLGGVVINVVRPASITIDEHVSETALDEFRGWDFTIPNDSDLDSLAQKVEAIFSIVADWAWGTSK
jgi:hypothetical protein